MQGVRNSKLKKIGPNAKGSASFKVSKVRPTLRLAATDAPYLYRVAPIRHRAGKWRFLCEQRLLKWRTSS